MLNLPPPIELALIISLAQGLIGYSLFYDYYHLDRQGLDMEKEMIIFVLALGVVATLLFFWSIYKTLKTKQNKYAWGMLPFIVSLFVLFFV